MRKTGPTAGLQACLSSLLLIALPCAKAAVPATASAAPGEPSLAVLFLIDRSPSTRSLGTHLDRLVEQMLQYAEGLARSQGLAFYFGAANFGGKLGKTQPLAPVQPGALPVLPSPEQVSYTDFRAPLRFALEQLDRIESPRSGQHLLVVLFTDGKASPAGSQTSDEAKKTYFFKTGPSEDGPPVAEMVREIRRRGGDVVLIAAGDDPSDAEIWRSILGSEHYISTGETSDPAAAARRTLALGISNAGSEVARLEALGTKDRLDLAASAPRSSAQVRHAAPVLDRWLTTIAITLACLVLLLLGLHLRLRAKYRRLQGPVFRGDVSDDQERSPRPDTPSTGAPNPPGEEVFAKVRETWAQDPDEAIQLITRTVVGEAKRHGVAFNRGLDNIAETISGCLLSIRADRSGERQVIKNLVEQATDDHGIALGLARSLVNRWCANSQIMIDELFILRARPEAGAVLRGIADLPLEQMEQGKSLASAVREIARATLRVSRQIDTVDSVVKSYHNLMDLGVAEADSEKSCYESIKLLATSQTLTAVPLPLRHAISADAPDLRRAFHSLLDAATDAFQLRPVRSEMADYLHSFLQLAAADTLLNAPEAEILSSAARRWLNDLIDLQESPRLVLERCVSMNLAEKEEDSDGGTNHLRLALLATNHGLMQAAGLVLLVTVQGDMDALLQEVGGGGPAGGQAEPGHWRVPLPEKPGYRTVARIGVHLAFTKECEVHLQLEFRSQTAPDAVQLSNRVTISLIPRQTAGCKILNRYVPDRPIFSDAQWASAGLAKGSNLHLCDELKTNPELRKGRTLILQGSRRTGKTSILRRFAADLWKNDPDLLPVYVDLLSWRQQLSTQNEAISEKGLFYELALAILDAVELRLENAAGADPKVIEQALEPLRKALLRAKSDLTLSRADFEAYLALVPQAGVGLPVMIIDELDAWIHDSKFHGNARFVLQQVEDLAANQGLCLALLAHDHTSSGWHDPLLAGQRSQSITRRVHFLEWSDLQYLADACAPACRFTALAVDLVWRFSGGWHGLAQLILYESVASLIRDGNQGVADAGIVKQTVESILGSTWQHFVSYLLGSLSEDEVRALEVIRPWVAADTAQIDGVRYSANSGYRAVTSAGVTITEHDLNLIAGALDRLRDKQIIQVVDEAIGTLRLRVGLLAVPRVDVRRMWPGAAIA